MVGRADPEQGRRFGVVEYGLFGVGEHLTGIVDDELVDLDPLGTDPQVEGALLGGPLDSDDGPELRMGGPDRVGRTGQVGQVVHAVGSRERAAGTTVRGTAVHGTAGAGSGWGWAGLGCCIGAWGAAWVGCGGLRVGCVWGAVGGGVRDCVGHRWGKIVPVSPSWRVEESDMLTLRAPCGRRKVRCVHCAQTARNVG